MTSVYRVVNCTCTLYIAFRNSLIHPLWIVVFNKFDWHAKQKLNVRPFMSSRKQIIPLPARCLFGLIKMKNIFNKLEIR